jgi:hypothetical protein
MLVSWIAVATPARAGILERISSGDTRWFPEFSAGTEDSVGFGDVRRFLRSPDRKVRFVDVRFEPLGLIRSVYVHTFEDSYLFCPNPGSDGSCQGTEVQLDSSKMDPSPFGHRQGFVLDNVETGFEGRFNDSGLYYRIKFELVPREKDGNRSSDYLKDAYFGWNQFTVVDVRMGRMKIPFGQANLKDTSEWAFVYNPTLDVLVPKRMLGAMVSVGDPWGIVKIRGGVFNSVKEANEQLLTRDSLMTVGRVEFIASQLLNRLGLRLWDLDWRFGASTAQVSQYFDPTTEHRWYGIDTRLHLALVTLEAEYAVKDFYLETGAGTALDSRRGAGFSVDAVLHVWPGVVDLALRYEEMDGDDELVHGYGTYLPTDELVPQSKRWISAGVKVHLSNQILMNVNYVNRKQREGYSFDNDVILVMFQYAM